MIGSVMDAIRAFVAIGQLQAWQPSLNSMPPGKTGPKYSQGLPPKRVLQKFTRALNCLSLTSSPPANILFSRIFRAASLAESGSNEIALRSPLDKILLISKPIFLPCRVFCFRSPTNLPFHTKRACNPYRMSQNTFHWPSA